MSEEKIRPFGLRDKLGYMFGDFGNDFTFILSSMMLMKFYSDVMGIDTALIGTMMMIARFIDAFTDITMGQIADRSRPDKKGKFLKWILRMCVPVALSSFLMYATWFRSFPLPFKIFWMFFTYIVWGSFFTLQSISPTAQWYRQFLPSQSTGLSFQTGAQSVLPLQVW